MEGSIQNQSQFKASRGWSSRFFHRHKIEPSIRLLGKGGTFFLTAIKNAWKRFVSKLLCIHWRTYTMKISRDCCIVWDQTVRTYLTREENRNSKRGTTQNQKERIAIVFVTKATILPAVHRLIRKSCLL